MVFDNHVILTGRVVRVPFRHVRPDGSLAIQFSLEVNQGDEDLPEKGVRDSKKSRIDIVALGPVAATEPALFQCGQYLRVEGRLRQRRWQTPEGRERSCVEVVATGLRRAEEIK